MFKVGEKVIATFYDKPLKCTVREVGVTCHLFDNDERVFYRIDGQADSICTGDRLKLNN